MNKDDKDQETELFGYWQTENYVPLPPIDVRFTSNVTLNILL